LKLRSHLQIERGQRPSQPAWNVEAMAA